MGGKKGAQCLFFFDLQNLGKALKRRSPEWRFLVGGGKKGSPATQGTVAGEKKKKRRLI